jgi:hypothetical protein
MQMYSNPSFFAFAVGVLLLATPPTLGQTTAPFDCGCKQDFAPTMAPFNETLVSYLKALTSHDRDTISKYSANFTLGPRHQRIHRSASDQQRLIDDLTKRNFTGFQFCGYMTSTAELKYPINRRRHQVGVCLRHLSDGGKTSTGIIVISCYRGGQRWLIDSTTVLAPFTNVAQQVVGREPR